MLNIHRLVCNPLQENCYILSDESNECVIIDCGAFYQAERDALRQYIDSHRLKPVRLLATHGHLDHNFGNNTVYEAYGLKPEAHHADLPLMETLKEQGAQLFGMVLDYDFPPMEHSLDAGDVVSFGTHQLQVLHTPGHTPGGVVYYCAEEQQAFTGDTLFRMSIGRTDFPGGSYQQMTDSLRNVLAKLPPATSILPGHGPGSTLEDELRYNPYLTR